MLDCARAWAPGTSHGKGGGRRRREEDEAEQPMKKPAKFIAAGAKCLAKKIEKQPAKKLIAAGENLVSGDQAASTEQSLVSGAPAVVLGCSKCRGNPKGCSQCRGPSFSGRRFQLLRS